MTGVAIVKALPNPFMGVHLPAKPAKPKPTKRK